MKERTTGTDKKALDMHNDAFGPLDSRQAVILIPTISHLILLQTWHCQKRRF